MPGRLARTEKPRRRRVAPHHLIRQDFHQLVSSIRLRTSQVVEDLILMQSVEGHAHEGHGAFHGQRYVNTTMEDIVESLGRNPATVASQRQALIDETVDWAKAAMEGSEQKSLVDEEGNCLLDMGMFRQVEVNPADVLKGLHLGGLRDDLEVRLEVEQRYGIQIGGGRCYLVDVQVMEEMGLDAERLAHGEHADQIEDFRRRGLITDRQPEPGDEDRIRYIYIRHRQGGGASDDAAIVAGGKLYNTSVALGIFLADAIDTLEKYVTRYSDQDYELAHLIEDRRPDLAADRDEVHRLTYLCAVPAEQKDKVPDSSLRHLLAIDRRTDQTALESHLAYIEGRRYTRMRLAMEQVDNRKFYRWFEERLQSSPE